MSLPDKDRLNKFLPEKSIIEQPDAFKQRLLSGLKEAKLDRCPLVVASDGSFLLVGVDEIQKFHREKQILMAAHPAASRVAWQKGFKNLFISFYEDTTRPPMYLRNINVAGRLGNSSEALIASLLLPVFGREEAQILRAFLVEKKALIAPNRATKAAMFGAMTESDRKRGMEELLFSSLLSHTTDLTRFLLDEGVSPNAYSDMLKFFALEWCFNCGANEQARLLLEFGADPKNPQFKNLPKMPADSVTRIIGALTP